jgi:hypothetical protein
MRRRVAGMASFAWVSECRQRHPSLPQPQPPPPPLPLCPPSLLHADVNTCRRDEVTADPGILEPTLSDVGRYNRHDPFRRYLLPNGDAFLRELDPHSGRHSFMMHANCYSLLAQFLHPMPIPVARLTETCRSCVVLRSPGRHLSWGPGHNYGGIIRLRTDFPWDEQDDYEGSIEDRYPEDPWSIPEVIRHLQSSQIDLSATQSKGRRSSQARWNMREPAKRCSARLTTIRDIVSNYFTRFPIEILEFILAYVPTDTVKSLARTSKGLNMIVPSRLGQSFWASRFQDPFEYSFVFEAQTYSHRLDWKSLYFSIMKDPSPRLQNRQRIWGLIQQLSELIFLQWKGNEALLPLDRDNEPKWKEVHGILQKPKRGQHRAEWWFGLGCRRLYSQTTLIPTLLRRIVIFTISIGTVIYITGLSFISNQGTNICVGYMGGGSYL